MALSGINWWQAHQAVEIRLLPPRSIEVSQRNELIWVAVQPWIIAIGPGETAVIDEITAVVHAESDQTAYRLDFVETGAWSIPETGGELQWDSGVSVLEPVVVTPTTPQSPSILFESVDPVGWAEGGYRLDISVHRFTPDEWLVATTRFEITTDDLAEIEARGSGGAWRIFAKEVAQ